MNLQQELTELLQQRGVEPIWTKNTVKYEYNTAAFLEDDMCGIIGERPVREIVDELLSHPCRKLQLNFHLQAPNTYDRSVPGSFPVHTIYYNRV